MQTTIDKIQPGQTFIVIGDGDDVQYTAKDDGSIVGENDKGNTTNPIAPEEFFGAALKVIALEVPT